MTYREADGWKENLTFMSIVPVEPNLLIFYVMVAILNLRII